MKTKKHIRSYCLMACSGILLFTGSCTHYFYAPTPMHTALLQKKHEVSTVVAAGQSDETNFYSMNMAYAITHKTGIYGTFYHAGNGNGIHSSGNGTYADLAIGKFDSLGRHLRYEAMIGVGNAHVLNNYGYQSGEQRFIENNFVKPYLQGNIGYRFKYLEACLALRAAYVHQYNIRPSDTTGMVTPQLSNWSILSANANQIALEPGVYISGGGTNWKLQLGLCRSGLIPFQSGGTSYNYQKAFISLGLKVNFTALK